MPALQDAEWEWLQTLLEHVNPYTGLAYRDDPTLAFMTGKLKVAGSMAAARKLASILED